MWLACVPYLGSNPDRYHLPRSFAHCIGWSTGHRVGCKWKSLEMYKSLWQKGWGHLEDLEAEVWVKLNDVDILSVESESWAGPSVAVHDPELGYCQHSLTHSLPHSWSWTLLEKLTVVSLFKNFPAFYGTRRFITVFTSALYWSLFWTRSIQSITIPSYLSNIHFNIVHPPTSWSSQWSLIFWLPRQYPIYIPLLPLSCYMPCRSHPLIVSTAVNFWVA
jgi:hypothetical protein